MPYQDHVFLLIGNCKIDELVFKVYSIGLYLKNCFLLLIGQISMLPGSCWLIGLIQTRLKLYSCSIWSDRAPVCFLPVQNRLTVTPTVHLYVGMRVFISMLCQTYLRLRGLYSISLLMYQNFTHFRSFLWRILRCKISLDFMLSLECRSSCRRQLTNTARYCKKIRSLNLSTVWRRTLAQNYVVFQILSPHPHLNCCLFVIT